jgi:hypothetical protein
MGSSAEVSQHVGGDVLPLRLLLLWVDFPHLVARVSGGVPGI